LRLQGTCPPFRESISWIISPFNFWTATIFLHAHLQVVYYNCVKCHKNPISRLGGVALTRYKDGWTDGQTGWFLYTPQTLFAGGIITDNHICFRLKCWCKWGIVFLLNMFCILIIIVDTSVQRYRNSTQYFHIYKYIYKIVKHNKNMIYVYYIFMNLAYKSYVIIVLIKH
jgi:hypothetical protein